MHVVEPGEDLEAEQARTEAAIASETSAQVAAPAEQITVPTQAEQQPAVEEFIRQIEQYQAPEPTVEQIMAAEPPPAVNQAEPVQEEPVFKAEPEAAGTDAEFYKMIGIDPSTLAPFANVEGELDASDLAINRAYKIDQANQQQIADDLANVTVTAPYDSSAEPGFEGWTPPVDFSTDQEPGFETWNPPETPAEDIPEIEITAPRDEAPVDDSEPGWEGWTPPPTVPDYSTFDEDMLRQIQDLPTAEELPITPAPKISVTPTSKTPAVAPVKTVAPVVKKPAAAPVVATPATQAAQGYMPGVGDVAHIKSLESLFGPILGTLLAEQTNEKQDDALSALEDMDQEYASGGHVDDFSVEALLHILRS